MPRPNIIWLTLESARADRTTMGGHYRDTTPNLSRIAASSNGVWFPNCFSHARWTPESTTSILTSTYSSTHRVGFEGSDPGKIPAELQTVPERLSERGYRTAMVTGNGYTTSSIGLAERFDDFDFPMGEDLRSIEGISTAIEYLTDFGTYGVAELSPTKLKRAVVPLLRAVVLKRRLKNLAQSDEPFFLYAHMNNLHSPYRPPPSFLKPFADDFRMTREQAVRFAQHVNDTIIDQTAHGSRFTPDEWAALKATYDGEFAFADALVGDVFTLSRRLDLSDTIFVVTGDHGELFGEQNLVSHNLVLHDGLTNVPMVVHGLPSLAERSNDIVGHVDVMRTLLERAGASVDGTHGIDLATETSEYAITQRGSTAEILSNLVEYNPDFDTERFHEGELSCIRSAEFKYQRSADRAELFRLPDETTDVSENYPDIAARLDAELDRRVSDTASYDRSKDAEFTDAMEEQLRDLGYL
ncbi:sulfatase [Halobium palmae]|uniref:Sulfatase n=1 Tax=Halobium palmae TaxID=1776492 RepID=A0ABD5RW02_9EURY